MVKHATFVTANTKMMLVLRSATSLDSLMKKSNAPNIC